MATENNPMAHLFGDPLSELFEICDEFLEKIKNSKAEKIRRHLVERTYEIIEYSLENAPEEYMISIQIYIEDLDYDHVMNVRSEYFLELCERAGFCTYWFEDMVTEVVLFERQTPDQTDIMQEEVENEVSLETFLSNLTDGEWKEIISSL